MARENKGQPSSNGVRSRPSTWMIFRADTCDRLRRGQISPVTLGGQRRGDHLNVGGTTRHLPRTVQNRTFAYQPALDGVRALAIVLVLLFHAGYGWMPGGYLGVSVFFTLSGFLITSLLLEERTRNRSIRVRAFYARRIRRLLPASLVCLAAISVLVAAGVAAVADTARADIFGALLQVTNWQQLLARSVVRRLVQRAITRHALLVARDRRAVLLGLARRDGSDDRLGSAPPSIDDRTPRRLLSLLQRIRGADRSLPRRGRGRITHRGRGSLRSSPAPRSPPSSLAGPCREAPFASRRCASSRSLPSQSSRRPRVVGPTRAVSRCSHFSPSA